MEPEPIPRRPAPCPPVGDVEALKLQLGTLCDAATEVVLALVSETGLSVRDAAKFAAICDTAATLALLVGEMPKPDAPVDEEMRDAMQASAGWGR